MLFIGLMFGGLVAVLCSFEPILANLGILIATLFPGTLGIGIAIGFISINTVLKYVSQTLTPNEELEGKTIENKKLVRKGKALSLAQKAMELHYTGMTASLIIGIVVSLIIAKIKIIPIGVFMLPFSSAIIGIPWIIYLFSGENKYKKIGMGLILGALAWFAVTTQGGKGTVVLFTSLFSLNAAIAGITKKEEKINNQDKSYIVKANKLPWGLTIVNGTLSSTIIGFPGAAAEKVIQVKKKKKNDDIYDALISAMSNGIQTGLGVFLFLLESIVRDNQSTILSVVFKDYTATHVEVAIILIMFIALSTFAKWLFPVICDQYIKYHNYKCNTNLEFITKIIGLVTVVAFLIMSSLSNVVILGALVGLTFGVNFLCRKLELEREIVLMITWILPTEALFGLI